MAWELYNTAPVAMVPWALDGYKIPVIVTPVTGGGFVVWNLDVMASQAETGFSSCAALQTFYEGAPRYDEKGKCWLVDVPHFDDSEQVRTNKFFKPTKKIKDWYEANKQWIRPVDELRDEANLMYSGGR